MKQNRPGVRQRRTGSWRLALLGSTLLAFAAAASLNAPVASAQSPMPGTGPGTGPALGPAPTGAPSAGAAIPAMRPLTDDEKAALKDVEAEYVRYATQVDKHNTRMRDVIAREFKARTDSLEKKYAERIAKSETERDERHTTTLALLEKFVKDHPNQDPFTPDAMYRLADLQLDIADRNVDKEIATNPDAIADYSKAMTMWEDILAKFPKYRQMPSTLYLLAYYSKVKDERRSLQLFLALTCSNRFKHTDPPIPMLSREEALARTESKTRRDPYADCQAMEGADPELVRHAWVRGIADNHFAVPGEVDDAISAYRKVADNQKDSSLYAEALYKLAWSYYKRDLLLDSIQKFDESVKLYDAVVAAGGQPQLELREESIQYISVAFTDPWEGETDSDAPKAFERAKQFYKGRENEPHVRDVWVAMGRAFVELQAYDQAVDAFRIAIGPPWELNPQNPTVHQEIATVFETKGDKFAADQVAAELATRYAPGSAWYTANEKDREAMENQRRIAERALWAAARNTHAAATTLRKEWEEGGRKDAGQRQEYLALYTKAAELYITFINQYPESDYVYEYTYLLGEALFFSERYLDAIPHYRWVAEHRELSDKYLLDASKSILAAYEKEAERQVAAGLIAALKVPTADELRAMPQPLTPKAIPEIYVTLQKEWDNYQNVVPDPKSAPIQGINAALVSLAYLHVDDAIGRLDRVMAKFCGAKEAVKAKDSLLSIYEATGRLDKFQETNAKFIQTKCGDAASIETAMSQNRSIEFRKAREMLEAKNYVVAAEAFYRYYKTAPAADKDLPTALYNAGVAYKLGDRPKTAIALFKEFTDNKDKLFRENGFYLEAKKQTALSFQGSLDFRNAQAAWLDLYETTKKAARLGIKPPDPIGDEKPMTLQQYGLLALYNAAFVTELDRDNKRAIELYRQYEKETPERREKDRAAWSIARIYRSAGDVTNMSDSLTKWRQKYGGDAGNEKDYVASFYELSKLHEKKGRSSAAEKAGRETVAAWRAKGAVKGSDGAKMASEWGLYFAEQRFAKFAAYRITDRARTDADAKKLRDKLTAETTATQDVLKALDDYGVAEVSMAAKVRYGETLAMFADKLVNMPTPKFILDGAKVNPDVISIWEETLGTQLKKYVNEARAQWEEVVNLAKNAGVSNKWSQLALENLGREFPDEFKVLHQELFTGTEAP